MMRSPFPLPDLVPLTRLHVQDSLRVNADRWRVAHNYHRQRQNLHYQSLWQPGIVQGLGVKLIPSPEAAHRQFQDGSWVEIQPGLAIDGEGNPIVVEPEPAANRTYHLVIPSPLSAPCTLYLVLRYVDPDSLEVSPQSDRFLERFRFDQRMGALEPRDIELCRIQLSAGEVQVTMPPDPFNPQANQLDLRDRPQAQLRPGHWLTVAALSPMPQHRLHSFNGLIEALPGLYPSLQVALQAAPAAQLSDEDWAGIDLIYCSADALVPAEASQQMARLSRLRDFLRRGCLLVETPTLTPAVIGYLEFLKRDLNLQPPGPSHCLRRQPFLFDAWPQPTVNLLCDEGLMVAVGGLAELWGGAGLSRTEIREAHEWGANLLHYVGQCQRFRRLTS